MIVDIEIQTFHIKPTAVCTDTAPPDFFLTPFLRSLVLQYCSTTQKYTLSFLPFKPLSYLLCAEHAHNLFLPAPVMYIEAYSQKEHRNRFLFSKKTTSVTINVFSLYEYTLNTWCYVSLLAWINVITTFDHAQQCSLSTRAGV